MAPLQVLRLPTLLLRRLQVIALYARVSTRNKDQNPETQLQPMREWVSRMNEQGVGRLPEGVIEYVDEASASDFRGRREWRRMLEDCRVGKVKMVMVWKLDRAFRSSQHGHNTLADLEKWGVGFRCHTQEIDTKSSMGRFIFSVFAAFAELEREMIKERVNAGIARARSEGKPVGRQPGSVDKKPRKRSGYFARWERERGQ